MTARRLFRFLVAAAAVAALLGGLFPPDARAADPGTERVNVSSDEAQALPGPDEDSSGADVSEDGRYVAFTSDAPNLVSSDTNNDFDVFVRDRITGTTERVSVSSGEAQASGTQAQISADGRYVAFQSGAADLVAGDTNAKSDVFVRDRQAGTTERVSVNSDETQINVNSGLPDMSADGRFVVFNVGDADADVFIRDRAAGTTEQVSVDNNGADTTGSSSGDVPTVSTNGQFVAFSWLGDTLVSGDSNGTRDVLLRNRTTGVTERVSSASDGTGANESSSSPGVSPDGRYVAFASNATNLVSGDTNLEGDIFRRDRQAGQVIRVNLKSDGSQSDGTGSGASNPSMSADARFVAFESNSPDLVAGDGNGVKDVFVRDVLLGTTVRGSVASDPNGPSFGPALAGATPYLAFDSRASNLVTNDSNGVRDVFVRQFRKASGYFVLDDEGGIFSFGSASYKGSVPGLRAEGVTVGEAGIVDLEVTPSGNGYYVLDDKGGIFAFGDAPFFGSMPALRAAGTCTCSAPVLDMAVTPSGQGYLILDQAGGIFTFGDATFFGSLPSLRNAGVPIGSAEGVDLSITPSGLGYLILDDIGGVFTFGDAGFFGSVPALRAAGTPIGNAPSIRLAITPTGDGYLVLDDVGGMFTFGDARFFGSIPSLRNAGTCTCPAAGVDLALTPTGGGYLILDDIGGIFTFGDGEFFGSLPALRAAGVAIGPNESIRVDLVSSMVGG